MGDCFTAGVNPCPTVKDEGASENVGRGLGSAVSKLISFGARHFLPPHS